MPTSTYTPLATVTLGSSASSVTFSSIPATYRDLILVFSGVGASGFDIRWRANGDTGSNYSLIQAGAGATTGGSFSNSLTGSGGAAGVAGTTASTTITQFIDYSATDKHKTSVGRGKIGSDFLHMTASRYASTLAITSLTLFGGTFNTGSTFNLYGVIA
jgi:hypothetical protein